MKKISVVFLTVILTLLIAGAVHVGIVYCNIAHDEYTSAPPEVAFAWLIPYAAVALLAGLAWLTVFLVKKHKRRT